MHNSSRAHHRARGRRELNDQPYIGSGGSAHLTPYSIPNEQTSIMNPPSSHADPNREPTVGHQTTDWQVRGVIRSGAFSAIGGDQVIQTVSSSYSAYPALHPPAHSNQNPSPSPSVLSDFRSQNPDDFAHPGGVTFGEGSFCAVSGVAEITNGNGRFTGFGTNSSVLPRRSTLPSTNGHTTSGTPFFVPGSHSAASGHHGPPHQCAATHAPNVLMGAKNFHTQDGYYEAGSFCAVGGNQFLTLDEPRRQPHRTHTSYPQAPSRYGSYAPYAPYDNYTRR